MRGGGGYAYMERRWGGMHPWRGGGGYASMERRWGVGGSG